MSEDNNTNKEKSDNQTQEDESVQSDLVSVSEASSAKAVEGGEKEPVDKGEQEVDKTPSNDSEEESVLSKKKIMPIIKASNLDFIYNPGKTNEFHALINITMEVYAEEFIMIFGPSGCGKSTLLNVIAGLEMPDKGTITVFDRDLTKMDAYDFAMYHRNEIGMVYQAYNLITSLTVLDNVVLPQVFVNVRKSRRKRWGKELLDRFGILDHANKIPTELSGGQQQRIGIARSIVNNPSIILADEPVGNLDSTSAKLVLEILADLNLKEKKTVIMVTHNPEYLDKADRILYMKDGVIVREVVNKEKNKKKHDIKPKTPLKEISELMRAYQGMTPEQINILIMPYKSKIFAHHFVTNCTMEELKVFEDTIQRKLLGTISEAEFYDILDKPNKEGGVGFDSRTAKKVARRMSRIIKMAYFVYQKTRQRKDEHGEHPKVTYSEKAEKVKQYLYETCYNDYYDHLSEKQDKRMKKIVKDRLMTIADKDLFFETLDKPVKEGGVGLNRKTAKAISEELELLIVLGFGVLGVSQKMANMKKENEKLTKKKEAKARFAEPEEPGIDRNVTPKDILNKMQAQLKQEVKTVDSSVSKKEDTEETKTKK